MAEASGLSFSPRHRLLKLLASNSLVLKEETADLEFYYHLLQPHVHYVPFGVRVPAPHYTDRDPARRQPRLDSVVTNLSDVLRAARQDDRGVRQIAERAHALAHTHLCDAARRCYLYELLRRYGRATTYQPSLADRPGARRVTTPEEVISLSSPEGTVPEEQRQRGTVAGVEHGARERGRWRRALRRRATVLSGAVVEAEHGAREDSHTEYDGGGVVEDALAEEDGDTVLPHALAGNRGGIATPSQGASQDGESWLPPLPTARGLANLLCEESRLAPSSRVGYWAQPLLPVYDGC